MLYTIFMICFLGIACTACYGAKEIDSWSYVYTLGVDKGVADVMRITVQVPTVKGEQGMGGQGTSGSQPENDFAVISVDCPTIAAGANMIDTSLSKTLNFMHAKYIVISEELAREGVGDFANGILRGRQIRRALNVIVVKGAASEFVREFNPVLGRAISKVQEDLINQEAETSLFDNISFNSFMDDMKSTYKQPTAALAGLNDFSHFKKDGPQEKEFKSMGDYYAGEIPRSGGNKFELLGTALFNGDKMIGELNGDETRSMLMSRGEFDRGVIAIQDPLDHSLRVSAEVYGEKKPVKKVTFKDGKPVISLKVFLEGDLQNIQSDIDYESEELKPVLEKGFREFIKGMLDKTINKCKYLNCDVFGFGEKAVMQFLTIQEWEEYNWKNKFKDATITTEVDFVIRHTGTMIRTNPTRTTEGKVR